MTACSAANTVATALPSIHGTPAATAKASASAAVTCRPAPAWLVAAIQEGITPQTPGAKLTHAFVLPAGAVTGFPQAANERLARGQLVAGTIAGGGASGQAVWVTDRTSPSASGTIIALNDVALDVLRLGGGVRGADYRGGKLGGLGMCSSRVFITLR